MTRQLRVAVLSGLFLLSSLAMVRYAQAQSAPSDSTAVMAQITDIPYFTLRDGMNSTLTLNNISPNSTPVTVTIYNLEGKAQVLKPITLAPHSFQQIELRDVIVGDEFDSGNLNVAYAGISMGVTCQVSVSNSAARVSFESRDVWGQQEMQGMMPSMTKNLSGILWLPQETTEGFLAVTNIGMNKETVHVSTGSKSKTISLYPRQTQLVKLSDEPGQHGPGASLVQLQQDGMPGDIVTTGFVLDLKRGYSSAFTMFDPGLTTSSHLAGAHLRIGKPEKSEDFPDGTYFRSPLLLANVSANPVVAHVSVDYTVREKVQMTPIDPKDADATEDKFKTVAAKTLTIAPGGVQRVELSDALQKLGIDRVTEAGVDVDYDTPPGTLIGHLVSVDQSGDYSFEVPIKDPAGMMENMEGIYPWTLEDGNNTVLHLKNTTNQPATGLLLFDYYTDGAFKTYDYPLISLEPYQTVAIDIRKLIESKTPDVLGHIIPADATHGQAQWRQEIPYSIIGRAEQTNVKEGIARSFSCTTACCINFVQTDYMSPGTLNGAAGGSGYLEAVQAGDSCNGVHFGPVADSTSGAWTTTNSNVATVSGSTVTYVGGGTAAIGASALYQYYTLTSSGNQCFRNTTYIPISAQVNVCVPASVRIVDDVASSVAGAQLVYNNYSNLYENEGTPTWGNDHCYTFQLVDSCGKDITAGNYEAVEHRTPFQMNPSGQQVLNNSTALLNGRWVDWMTYLWPASPGVPTGWLLKVNQTMHIVNQTTGRDDVVAAYCQYYDPYNVYHYSGSCQ
jgi:hypothetical protein